MHAHERQELGVAVQLARVDCELMVTPPSRVKPDQKTAPISNLQRLIKQVNNEGQLVELVLPNGEIDPRTSARLFHKVKGIELTPEEISSLGDTTFIIGTSKLPNGVIREQTVGQLHGASSRSRDVGVNESAVASDFSGRKKVGEMAVRLV